MVIGPLLLQLKTKDLENEHLEDLWIEINVGARKAQYTDGNNIKNIYIRIRNGFIRPLQKVYTK